MPEVHSLLKLLRFERPPLGAANTLSIRQCRCPAGRKAGQPITGCAITDPVLNGQFSKGPTLIQTLADQAFPTRRRQAGIGGVSIGSEVLGCWVAPQPSRPQTLLSAGTTWWQHTPSLHGSVADDTQTADDIGPSLGFDNRGRINPLIMHTPN